MLDQKNIINNLTIVYNRCLKIIRRELEIEFANFEKNFHSMMDGLEEHMKTEYKKYFATDEAGWIRFYEEMVWHIKVALIIFPFLCFFQNNDLPIFGVEQMLPIPFEELDFPADHIIVPGLTDTSKYFPVYDLEIPRFVIGCDLDEVRADIMDRYDLNIGINWFLY